MKALLLFVLLLGAASPLLAQPGVMLGGNFSNQHREHGTITLEDKDKKAIPGLSVQLLYRTRPVRGVLVEPSLTYAQKGSRYMPRGYAFNWAQPEYIIDKLHYLQLSLPLVYPLRIAKSSSISFGAGPYLSYLFKATRHTHYEYVSPEVVRSVLRIGPDQDDDYKRFDLGIRMSLGVRVRKVLCTLNYDIGLTDVITYDYEVARNHTLSLSIGLFR
jgi:hypothetical protein